MTTHKLTKRERQICDLVIRGYRYKQVAALLKITCGTVKLHMHHVYEKLNVHNRVQLILNYTPQVKPLLPPHEIDWCPPDVWPIAAE